MSGHAAGTGVYGSLCGDTGIHDGTLGRHERYSLTLHVRAHEGTVRIIVLEERNHGCRDGEDHLRGDIHHIYRRLRERLSQRSVTAGDIVMYKMSVLVKRLVCLCYDVVILFVGSEVNDLVGNGRVLRVGRLVDNAVRRLDEAVLINTGEGCERVDEADVRSFRCLDRAHPAVMRIVYIADLEAGTVSRKTARAEGGKSSLMCELGERVVLVHELREL